MHVILWVSLLGFKHPAQYLDLLGSQEFLHSLFAQEIMVCELEAWDNNLGELVSRFSRLKNVDL